MNQLELPEIIQHIKLDNYQTEKLYLDLTRSFTDTLKHYPIEINLFGVYFLDILKILSRIILCEREINHSLVIEEYKNKKIHYFPYISYKDFDSKPDILSKIYGKNVSIHQTKLKKILNKVLSSKFLLTKKKHNVAFATPRVDSGRNLFWRDDLSVSSELIQAAEDWFALPDLEKQLDLIKNHITLLVKNHNFIFDPNIIGEVISNHIKANCKNGMPNMKLKSDFVILRSGNELTNRMIGITAMQQKIPVINIMHGESFGVYDHPIASKYCEQLYSTGILGYGEKNLSIQDSYKYKNKENVVYIPSNAPSSFSLFKEHYMGVTHKKINYFYFPTSLRGLKHRHGPFMDAPDEVYLLWQNKLSSIFGDSITMKAHPKEKYKASYKRSKMKMVFSTIFDALDGIDVFIFDFIGSAFNEACATDKPVIYFDLGIQNINSIALQYIKERTIYFDVSHHMPDMLEIQEKVGFTKKNNNYSINFSLYGERKSRIRSLTDSLDKVI